MKANSMLQRLHQFFPPPVSPMEVPPKKYWEEYPISFPPDYIDFITSYGSGRQGDLFWYNPHSTNPWQNLFSMLLLFEYQTAPFLRSELGFDLRIGLQVNGYLPLARTGSGLAVFFSIGEDLNPLKWGIGVLDDANDIEMRHYDVGWVEFLVRLLEGEWEADLLRCAAEGAFQFTMRSDVPQSW